MAKNVIVIARKLNHAKSNIKYLQDRKDHPETCLFYNTTSMENWDSYIKKNQEEFKRSNQKGRCNEARELIFVFPQEYYKLPNDRRKRYLIDFAEKFKKQYGVDCIAAMHGKDKDSNNMHIHLMYMERRWDIKEHITKIAPRRLYFNDRGVQVKTRAMCLDEDGKMLPGYSFVKKGEEYVVQQGGIEWSAKDEKLRSNSFTEMQKRRWAYRLNKDREKDWAKETGIDKVEDRKCYEHEELFLRRQVLRKPKKYRDKEKQERAQKHCDAFNRPIKQCNNLRDKYNRLAKKALEDEKLTREELWKKTYDINQEIKKKLKNGQGKEIKELLENVTHDMIIITSQNRQNGDITKDIDEALKEFENNTKLENIKPSLDSRIVSRKQKKEKGQRKQQEYEI